MSEIPVTGPKNRRMKKRKDTPLVDRQLPYSLEAEMGVLGSLMLTPDSCDDVVAILRTEDFFDESHGIIFRQMMEMHGSGNKIDPLLLREKLMASGEFETIGGAARLVEIFNTVTHAAHVVYYANIVRNKATARNLITTCSELLNDAFLPETEPNDLLNAAEQKVFAIRESRQSTNLAGVAEILEVAMDRLEAKAKGEVLAGTVETHFRDLDDMTGGLHASELLILAARPSMGKTAFALNITENVATISNKPVLFVSLEMASIELIERMLCSRARVNGHRLRKGTLNGDERKQLVKAAGELSTAPLFIDDSPTRNVSEIAGAARRIIRREGGLALIVIDYLQLLQPDNSRDPRQEQVAKMARKRRR